MRACTMHRHVPHIEELLRHLESDEMMFRVLPADIRRYIIAPMVLHPYTVIGCTSNSNLLIRDGSGTCNAYVRGMDVGPATHIAIRGDCFLLRMDDDTIREYNVHGLKAPCGTGSLITGHIEDGDAFRYRIDGGHIHIPGDRLKYALLSKGGRFSHVLAYSTRGVMLYDGERTIALLHNGDVPSYTKLRTRPVAIAACSMFGFCLLVYSWGGMELMGVFFTLQKIEVTNYSSKQSSATSTATSVSSHQEAARIMRYLCVLEFTVKV